MNEQENLVESRLLQFGQLMLGWVLIVIGLITLPMPFPVGLILLIIGLSILVPANKRVRIWLCKLRRRHPKFDQRLKSMQSKLPKFANRLILLTDPNSNKL